MRRAGLDHALITLDGRYHVVDRIAAGGMGEVFRAHDAVLERDVAIKVLHRQLAGDRGFVERFRREARAAASLSYPNIVGVHDWGAVDGIYYMVMEYVRGLSAREVLNAEGVLAPAQAVDVLLQTLLALDHAHRRGIVHRDVKPENIMITREGVVKVADFGLARAYADAQITEAGTVTGTVQYLAPEQLQGEPADPRTDLYALGIVAFELLTGRLPFTGETPMAIAYKHVNERIPTPSSRNAAVPKVLDGWVASMTEKQRELRPESAAEARRDLLDEATSLPPAPNVGTLVPDVTVLPSRRSPSAAATTVTIARAQVQTRRRRWRKVVGIVFGLVILATAAWGAWTYVIPHRVDVPSVIGLDVRDAQRKLENVGLVARIALGRHSLRVDEGAVLDVRPDEGTVVEDGTRVVLVPSAGPPPVRVPNIVGKTLERARELLRGAELRVGDLTRAYHAELAEGHVIRQSVDGRDDAPLGSAIDVVVSRGPKPIPVPRVAGRIVEDATALLEDAGFVVARTDAFSDDVARGRVISQDPARGRNLQPGETVSIVVSLGPEEFELPSFLGLGRDEAIARIHALGLEAQVVPVPGGNGSTVVSQLPPVGENVRAGDTIAIYVA
jgi:eukaryotic-like serine/threonine-protein kinase